ncbi:MAG TPA: DUF2510 domain-containing protein [Nocardioidaceae bacterium]|nr:DUF2510 domain-containing protein [Nocardioidaceae bacterium]
MQADATRAADWYDDPENPGRLRYWNGSAWTDHRAEPMAEEPQRAPAVQAAHDVVPPTHTKPEGEEASFGLVVAGVLGGAAVLIAVIVVVVVWFDSYNTGKARGEQALEQGIPASKAESYCNAFAKDIGRPGSADGYWDLPWVWGCKRGLG